MAAEAEEITAAADVINAIAVAEPGHLAAEVDKRLLFPHPLDPKPCMELPHHPQKPALLNMAPPPPPCPVMGSHLQATLMTSHRMALETGGLQPLMWFLCMSLEAGELNITYTSHCYTLMAIPFEKVPINYCIYYFFIHYLLYIHTSVFFYSRFLLLRDVDEKIYFHHLFIIYYLLIGTSGRLSRIENRGKINLKNE